MVSPKGKGRTELDSHDNICVIRKHCYLLSELSTARTVNVGAFTELAGGLNEVPIIDVMLAYDCKQTNQVYLLILQNVLYIESVDDNLIPPFILQEAGIIVNKQAKIYCEPGTATEEDYIIQERKTGFFLLCNYRAYSLIF